MTNQMMDKINSVTNSDPDIMAEALGESGWQKSWHFYGKGLDQGRLQSTKMENFSSNLHFKLI